MKKSAGFCFWLWVAAVFPAAVLRAELVWEQPVLTIESQSGQAEARGTFRFTNRGKKTVNIIIVRPSCGCTAAKPDRDVFGPGESGQLSAEIVIGNRLGLISVSIVVETDDDAHPTHSLTMNVNIAEAVQMTPRVVFWKVGEALTPKRVALKPGKGVKIAGAEVEGGKFVAKLAAGLGDERVLWVTPISTAGVFGATMLISATEGENVLPETSGFLRVVD